MKQTVPNLILMLIASLFTSLYVIWVHMTVYNMFMPKAFGLPEIGIVKTMIIGIVGCTFFTSTDVSLLVSKVKKNLTSDEKFELAVEQVTYRFAGATAELIVAYIFSSFLLRYL